MTFQGYTPFGYYKILAIVPMLYNIYEVILYLIVYTSYSPIPIIAPTP